MIESKELKRITHKVLNSERISEEDAIFLYTIADLNLLGYLANEIRLMRHPSNYVTFVVDRNINYTNICVSGCKFCAFYKKPDENGGYVISFDELRKKLEETKELGGTQILLQGGLHPQLPFSFYKEIIGTIKSYGLHCHGFSPPEIVHFSKMFSRSIEEVLYELVEVGLDSIPGGGAEILSDRVRSLISPNKANTSEWLLVMETAHRLGLKTTATMMFGHVETLEERIVHLRLLRDLQDKTGGFTAFIPWTFQRENTMLSTPKASSYEYLKMLAISRIFLDNFDNIQVSYVTQGYKIAQIALYYGANDFGSAMIEENVVAATGTNNLLTVDEIRKHIADAGFIPRQRRMDYSLI